MKGYTKFLWAALAVFLLTIITVITLQSTVGGFGFNPGWSVSRYMGASAWSAVVFAISNFVVIFLISKYLHKVWQRHKFSKLWMAVMLIMMVFYIGVSIFPIGLFDAEWGNYGPVSILHRISSSGLFVTMLITVIITLIETRKKASQALRYFGTILILYALFAGASYLTNSPICQTALLYLESGYIVANVVFYRLI